MANITQPTDFVGELFIANAAQPGVAGDLQWFIAKYEPLFLTYLLGADVYASFMAGLPAGAVTITDNSLIVLGTGTKFTTYFEVGDNITVNGETQVISLITNDTYLETVNEWVSNVSNAEYYREKRWIDLLNFAQLKPAIASYIYYYYIRNQVTQTVGMGNVEPKSANATTTSNGRKQTRAFNEMVKYVYDIIRYVTTSGLFPEYVEPQWLRWRMQQGMLNWWIQDYYLYPIGFRNIPEIFNSITENNI